MLCEEHTQFFPRTKPLYFYIYTCFSHKVIIFRLKNNWVFLLSQNDHLYFGLTAYVLISGFVYHRIRIRIAEWIYGCENVGGVNVLAVTVSSSEGLVNTILKDILETSSGFTSLTRKQSNYYSANSDPRLKKLSKVNQKLT